MFPNVRMNFSHLPSLFYPFSTGCVTVSANLNQEYDLVDWTKCVVCWHSSLSPFPMPMLNEKVEIIKFSLQHTSIIRLSTYHPCCDWLTVFRSNCVRIVVLVDPLVFCSSGTSFCRNSGISNPILGTVQTSRSFRGSSV